MRLVFSRTRSFATALFLLAFISFCRHQHSSFPPRQVTYSCRTAFLFHTKDSHTSTTLQWASPLGSHTCESPRSRATLLSAAAARTGTEETRKQRQSYSVYSPIARTQHSHLHEGASVIQECTVRHLTPRPSVHFEYQYANLSLLVMHHAHSSESQVVPSFSRNRQLCQHSFVLGQKINRKPGTQYGRGQQSLHGNIHTTNDIWVIGHVTPQSRIHRDFRQALSYITQSYGNRLGTTTGDQAHSQIINDPKDSATAEARDGSTSDNGHLVVKDYDYCRTDEFLLGILESNNNAKDAITFDQHAVT
ncbi:hypothetical protein DFH29DRAFT_912192 [Suillus ampliporus]|nr:hypothetical protein DFH29DRAFT_912192 [Suillus ampliporus]